MKKASRRDLLHTKGYIHRNQSKCEPFVNSDDGEFLPLTTAGLQEFLHGSGKDPLSLSPFGDVPLQTAPLSLAFCRPTCNRKASNQQAASLFVNMKNHLLK